MNLFKSKAEKELEGILDELKANLENNYKSTAQAARVRLGERRSSGLRVSSRNPHTNIIRICTRNIPSCSAVITTEYS